jgi:hypothetical protein
VPQHGTVTYQITGFTSSLASVTMEAPAGISQVAEGTPVPYNKPYYFGRQKDEFLYVPAQNDLSYGSVTCRIIINGRTVSINTFSGAHVIASCYGSFDIG